MEGVKLFFNGVAKFIKQTAIHLWAFLHESAIRFSATSPAYFRRMGRYLWVLFGLCAAFEVSTTEFFGKLSGFQIVPQYYLDLFLKFMSVGALFGRFLTTFSIDDDKLTPAERKALDELRKLQHPDVPAN